MSKRQDYFYMKGRKKLEQPYHLASVGLPYVYLLNGVTFEDDPDYGSLVTIENPNGLHRAIGLSIIERPEPMDGTEVRFLRKQLSLTQEELAGRLRVSDQTVANYEKGFTSIPGPTDMILRINYIVTLIPEEARAELVKSIIGKMSEHKKSARLPEVTRRRIVQGWEECPLAA